MTPFTGNSSNNNSSRVPPGFRFHPTDEELVGYYLHKKVASKKIDLDVIHEIDLYKLEPWDLHERCKIGSAEQSEWYFFSHKDKKYPTGTRTNRATAAGFWKATGRDKAIHAKYKLIGMRKTLVFYKGRAPNGQKTDWIMHEYRLEDENTNATSDDGWVVCRVFKKRNSNHKVLERDFYDDQIAMLPELDSPNKFVNELIPQFHQHHQMINNCKQEFEFEHIGTFSDPFSQHLPQLESPRLTPVHYKEMSLLPHPALFTLPPPVEASSFHRSHQQPVTDWRMVDRIAAAQLSHEGDTGSSTTSKEPSRFPDNPVVPEGHHCEDVALLLRLSKQQSYDSNDGDLWSFHGR